MKKLLGNALILASLSFGITAHATTWYGWDNTDGLVAYDADTGAKTDLPGGTIVNLSLALNPVNGEMWGFTGSDVYQVDVADGTFTLVHSINVSGEASSFDLAGNFYVTQGSDLYQVDLGTGNTTLVQNIGITPDGFDVLPDGRWIANDSGTIYLLASDWTLISSWSGPANETIASDENGRVFGSNGTDLHEIDIVNETSTLLWTDAAASAIWGSEATSAPIVATEPVPVPASSIWSMIIMLAGLLTIGLLRLARTAKNS